VSLETNLIAYLLSQSPVTALVGTRIYKVRRPQATTLPAITVSKVGQEPSFYQAKASSAATARFQISCWGATQDAARSVAEAVRGELDGYRAGTWGSGGTATTILCADHLDDYDLADEPNDGSDIATYQIASDYTVSYRKTVPTFA